MTYLETLRKSKDKPQVAFQEFALSTRKYPTHLFCFFEGKDNAYYVPRIKRFTQYYQPIKCGNRESVLKVHTLISHRPEYSQYKKAFFIDRDFNAPLEQKSPPVFVTPCYSIENFYASVDVFREILINAFHLSEVNDSKTFETCISLYQNRQNEFHDSVGLLNAWYACLIEIRNSTGQTTGVKLDEKLPKGFISITLQSISRNYNLDMMKSTFPNATEVEEATLNNKLTEFESCDRRNVFRGKYELQFLIDMIRLLLADSQGAKTIIKQKMNFAFGDASSIGQAQALNIFTAYAETPSSLNDYLRVVS